MNSDAIRSMLWSIEQAAHDIESLVADLEEETSDLDGIHFVDGDQLYVRDLIADTRRNTMLMKDREPTDIELAEAIVDYIKQWQGRDYA